MTGTSIIVGNILSLCATVSDSISGTVQNAVAVFRNLAAMKKVKSRVLEWILIAAGVVLGIVFNNRGLLGWLPIVANLEYSIAVFRFRDNEIALKSAFIVNMIMYAAFSAVILNYVGIASCAVIAVTTAISLIKAIRKKRSGETEEESPAPEEAEKEDSAADQTEPEMPEVETEKDR